jgi:hypothetical protein
VIAPSHATCIVVMKIASQGGELMSKEAAEHHRKAAEHHEHAAKHHHAAACVWQVKTAHFGSLIWPTLSY